MRDERKILYTWRIVQTFLKPCLSQNELQMKELQFASNIVSGHEALTVNNGCVRSTSSPVYQVLGLLPMMKLHHCRTKEELNNGSHLYLLED